MKTIQDLEKEKLEGEISILRARLKHEFPEHKPRGWFDKVSGFFRKWYSVVLAIIAVAGGFWGIFYPVKTYFNEQQKAVQYDINENMIDALKGLESEDLAAKENSIIILSYYDLNAIPILLNKYIVSDYFDKDLQQDYIEAISLIYNRKQNEIVDRIIIKMRKNYNLLNMDEGSIRIYPLLHLSELLNNLDIVNSDKMKVKKFYAGLIADLKKNNVLLNIDGVPIFKAYMEDFIKKNNQ